MKSKVFYSSKKVIPIRSVVSDVLRDMKPGQAFNIETVERQRFVTAISRLHKKKEGRWKTMKISNEQIAVVRKD